MAKAMRLCSVLLCCLLLTACATAAAPNIAGLPQTDERLLSEVRTQYRSASLIVEGVCVSTHINAQGNACYDLEITEVLAGSAQTGEMIECTKGSMNVGETYVLFLQDGDYIPYAEDTAGFNLLSDTPLPVTAGEVIWGGKRITVAAMKDEIAQLNNIINAPAQVFYYDTIAALVEAADEIFIGEVAEISPLAEQAFYIKHGGTAQKTQYEAARVSVRVLGSIKGALGRYGTIIQMIQSPARVGTMLSAATLQNTQHTQSDVAALRGGNVYLFFLIEGPDAKQPYYFPLNPVQGYVQIDGDVLNGSAANTPVAPYETLTDLVKMIHTAMDWVQPGSEDTPPLVVEEE